MSEKELKAKVKKLEAENKELKQELEKLGKQIDQVKEISGNSVNEHGSILQQSGIPRGEWSYAKGQFELSSDILGIFDERPVVKPGLTLARGLNRGFRDLERSFRKVVKVLR